jgi:hypothetical protein
MKDSPVLIHHFDSCPSFRRQGKEASFGYKPIETGWSWQQDLICAAGRQQERCRSQSGNADGLALEFTKRFRVFDHYRAGHLYSSGDVFRRSSPISSSTAQNFLGLLNRGR